jgi:osmotically-inducible protein OsmY
MSFMRTLPVLTVLLLLAGCAGETCQDRSCSPDDRLVEAVTANIHRHPALLADHLRVQADHGVVYLYGLVASNLELVDVEDIAKATTGVTKVVNMCAIDNVVR